MQAIKKVPNRAWVPARCFWTIPADRHSCDILLHNIYSEGFCRAASGGIGKDCESNDSDPHDGVPLNTEMIWERTLPTEPDIQCILHKLEEVITAKHYCKRNSFVSRLAVKENTAASSKNQALSALLFLYKNILGITIKSPENIVRAKKQEKGSRCVES